MVSKRRVWGGRSSFKLFPLSPCVVKQLMFDSWQIPQTLTINIYSVRKTGQQVCLSEEDLCRFLNNGEILSKYVQTYTIIYIKNKTKKQTIHSLILIS